MKGQLTYNKLSGSWKFTKRNNLTSAICQSAYKVQSRSSYYLGYVGGERREFNSLNDGIKWVEQETK